MKGNLIILKTQESQEELYTNIEPKLTQKLAQNGVDIVKTIVFKRFEELNKNLFSILESCSIILLDTTITDIDSLYQQVDKFYLCNAQNINVGKVWNDVNMKRQCLLFDINDLNFIDKIENDFLRKLFVPTKFLTIIKTYGIDEGEIRKVLTSINTENGFEWYTTSNFMDCEIDILTEGDLYNSEQYREYIRYIYSTLGEYIYSDNENSLFETLAELLSIRKSKIAICDTLTNGLFHKMLCDKLNNYYENISSFYNMNANKKEDYIDILKMSPTVLMRNQLGSSEIVYEMAVTMLDNTKANFALVLTGTPENPCIALGDNEAIHLYKFNFNHIHSFINNVMVQTSIFKLIKKLNKNSGLF